MCCKSFVASHSHSIILKATENEDFFDHQLIITWVMLLANCLWFQSTMSDSEAKFFHRFYSVGTLFIVRNIFFPLFKRRRSWLVQFKGTVQMNFFNELIPSINSPLLASCRPRSRFARGQLVSHQRSTEWTQPEVERSSARRVAKVHKSHSGLSGIEQRHCRQWTNNGWPK